MLHCDFVQSVFRFPSVRALATFVTCLAVSCLVTDRAVHAQPLIEVGDVVLGVGGSEGLLSVEIASGPIEEFGGLGVGEVWDEPFLQGLELDNLNGISHNPAGNLLATNFGGGSDTGGSIHILPTDESAIDNDNLLTGLMDLPGVDVTRIGGLSVSPDNTKIAVSGYDSGRVIVFDYTAGDGLGNGASVSNARQTTDLVVPQTPGADTQGTTWLNANSVLSFSADGELRSIDATAMTSTVVATIDTGSGPSDNRSEFTDLEYNPTVSPFIYASYSGFDRDDAAASVNQLFVIDPRDSFSLVNTVNLFDSTDSMREIALGPDGTLFLSQFNATIDVIPNATDGANIADASGVDWYTPFNRASFSGLDVAVGLPIDVSVPGDFNGDGALDATDIDQLTEAVRGGQNPAEFDVTGDGNVNEDDRQRWINELRGTYLGDANLDGEFGSGDMVAVFVAGEYEDNVANNSTWATGDWNGDSEFGSGDLVAAFVAGGFEQGPRAATAAVPEPAIGAFWLMAGLLAIGRRIRR